MNNKTKEIFKLMERDEFDSEINDEEIVLETLKFQAIPLLYLTEDIKKGIDFLPRSC